MTVSTNGFAPTPAHYMVTDAGVSPVVNTTAPSRVTNELLQLIANDLSLSRRQLFNWLTDPRRNFEHECGWPEGFIDAELYQRLYERNAIAARVVQIWPRQCWQVQPVIYEVEEAESETPFEAAWQEVGLSLQGDNSRYRDDTGSHPVFHYLARADELCGIGAYGVILLGIDDGLDLSQPAEFVTGGRATATRKLLYLRVFPESLARIAEFDTDPLSPRFGQPTMYQLTFNDPRNSRPGMGMASTMQMVHWTRVVHIADNLEGSEVFGVPRLQAVINNVLDLKKLYGGSAEMYWRGAFGGLSLETHPTMGGDVAVDVSALQDMMEERNNGVQRDLFLRGLTAKSLAPNVSDPTAQITVQLQAICIAIDVPMRIFMGSERGDLASQDDRKNMANKVRGRRQRQCTLREVMPLIDRFVALGVLPVPAEYHVWWPDSEMQSETEQADVALKRTQALAQYVAGGCEAVVAPVDYLSRFQGMTEEEAETVVESAAERVEEEEIAEEAMREEVEAEMASQAQTQAGATAAARTAEGEDE